MSLQLCAILNARHFKQNIDNIFTLPSQNASLLKDAFLQLFTLHANLNAFITCTICFHVELFICAK